MDKIQTQISIFKNNKIRRVLYKNEWFFSMIDGVEALTDSVNARDYWFKLKTRFEDEEGFQLSTICLQLKMIADDVKMRETDCSNTEGVFCIIQSIPSPKAEPFKRWLAKVGFERVKEIEDPELGAKRTRMHIN
jgi:DNA-damage-inducible protein D